MKLLDGLNKLDGAMINRIIFGNPNYSECELHLNKSLNKRHISHGYVIPRKSFDNYLFTAASKGSDVKSNFHVTDLIFNNEKVVGVEGKFSNGERAVVNSRLEQFKATILQEKFTVYDSNLFESKMNEFSMNFNNSLDPITWIFDLLRASSNEDLDLNDFGIEILPQFSDLSLSELRDLINQEMLQLSEAHYYKFFNQAT